MPDIPPPPPPPPRRSPSKRHGSDRYILRLYRNDSADVQVYTHVKHAWWQAGNTVLAILHYNDDRTYRYVYWLREKIDWYSMELE